MTNGYNAGGAQGGIDAKAIAAGIAVADNGRTKRPRASEGQGEGDRMEVVVDTHIGGQAPGTDDGGQNSPKSGHPKKDHQLINQWNAEIKSGRDTGKTKLDLVDLPEASGHGTMEDMRGLFEQEMLYISGVEKLTKRRTPK